MSSPPTSIPRPTMSAVAAGPGTPALPAGCIAPGWKRYLGLRLTGSALHLDPCIPESWPGFEVTLRRGSTRFDIRVDNPDGVAKGIASARIDGTEIAERPLRLDLPEDGKSHEIQVVMG